MQLQYDESMIDSSSKRQYQSLEILMDEQNGMIQTWAVSSSITIKDDSITEKALQIFQLLENLQPDPYEDEDAFKSSWDLVRELYGQEATKNAEKNGDLEWNIRCSIVRLLIHYNFLTQDV